MKRALILFIFSFFSYAIQAQSFMRPNEWKKYKREIFFTLGTSGFLGDLGGQPGKGKQYSPADLNFNQSRAAVGFGARYKLQRSINVAGKFSYLNVRGDDAKTTNVYRNNRNLNFKSNIYELSVRVEAGYQSTKRGGSRYGVRRNYGRMKNITHNLYGFLGVGAFYYNPKGREANGTWVALRPLHTEGQGLPGGPKQYSNFSVCIPIGVYYKVTINKVWSLGIEFCYRKTFTDYIDDVGGTYYDPKALAAAYGPLSAQMADPSLGRIPGATKPNGDGTPAQRGSNSQKDAYMSLEVTASYIFKKARKSARLRSKF
jgi:hypothetical protein